VSERTESTFRLSYSVDAVIAAPLADVWAKLTDAASQESWNSTVSQLTGPIAPGSKLAIQVPAAPGRTFTPKVVEFEPPHRMVWADGFAPMFRGVRTFTLTASGDTATHFHMDEVYSGAMLPMIKGSLPDFGSVFDTYAADLKRACET
jgi:hypothetical protein